MGKLIDLTGQRFGNLVVIEKAKTNTNDNHAKWVCQCDCGNIKEISGRNLRKGATKSCGCQRYVKDSVNFVDEIGNRYGKLVVIEREPNDTEGTYKGWAKWKCKCDCGNTKTVYGQLLRKGHVKSCGCYKNILDLNPKFKDLTGQKFGLLTVLYPCEERSNNGSIKWHCKCKCGNEKDILGSSLTSNKTHSCGCLKSSFGEYLIANLLKENNFSFETEKTFDSCRFDSNKLAKFDFYVDNKYIIEYDGDQHFFPNSYYGGEEGFKRTVYRDKVKNEWTFENGIPIIRIPYTHCNDLCIEDLMPETSSFILHK